MDSLIKRIPNAKIVRSEEPKDFRNEYETADAQRMGGKPLELKNLFRDTYEFYQNNEY